MAINVRKLANDIFYDDEDIRILALTTIVQLSAEAVEEPSDLPFLAGKLGLLLESPPDDDTEFLAKKALNKVRLLQKELDVEEEPSTVPPAAEDEGREEVYGGQELAAAADDEDSLVVVQEAEAEEETEGLADSALDANEIKRLVEATEDPVERASLLSRLKECRDFDDWNWLARFLKSADDRVRANAVEVVEELGDERTRLLLLSPLLEDTDNRVRANAAKALGALDSERVHEILETMIASPRLSMRESAVYALCYLKSVENVDLLIRALSDPYEGIRLRAVKGLARHKDPRAIPALKERLNDLDINVCEAAEQAISFISCERTPKARQEKSETARHQEERTPGAASSAPAAAGRTQSADSPAGGAAAARPDPAVLRAQVRAGRKVYELCKAGAVKHRALLRIYYEITKLKMFRARHMEARRKGLHAESAELRRKLGIQPGKDPVEVINKNISRRYKALFDEAVALLSRGEIERAELPGEVLELLPAGEGGAKEGDVGG